MRSYGALIDATRAGDHQGSNVAGSRRRAAGAGDRSPGRRAGRTEVSVRRRLPLPVRILLISLFVPWIFSIGPLTASPYRLVLIVMIVPCLVRWMSGKAGRIRFADITLLLFSLWCVLALVVLHGVAAALQPAGILFVETMGGYLMARCYIRDADDFHSMVRLLFWMVALLLPFALFETLTGRNLSRELFAAILPAHPDWYMPPRWGLRRVQAVYEHPILFGVSTGSIVALVHLVLGDGATLLRRGLKTGLVAFTASLSLSSGAISAVAAQLLLLLWNFVLRHNPNRWRMLFAAVALMYVMISAVSNQSVPEFYLTHFSFDQESAYYRILIWEFGSASALNHPLFGVPFEQWDRPDWMPPSIDMFWLLFAVYHGIPAGILLLTTFLSLYVSLLKKRRLTHKVQRYRTGYLIAMTGFFLVGWTVHFWNATYVLFLLLLGSGVWILGENEDQATGTVRRHRAGESAAAVISPPRPATEKPRGDDGGLRMSSAAQRLRSENARKTIRRTR